MKEAGARNRTENLSLTKRVLYRLSYAGPISQLDPNFPTLTGQESPQVLYFPSLPLLSHFKNKPLRILAHFTYFLSKIACFELVGFPSIHVRRY